MKTTLKSPVLSTRAKKGLCSMLEITDFVDDVEITLDMVLKILRKIGYLRMREPLDRLIAREMNIGKLTAIELKKFFEFNGITNELVKEMALDSDHLSQIDAIDYIEQALDRIRNPSPSASGGEWQAGGCYWRLMKVIRFYVEPALIGTEGEGGANRLKRIHGKVVEVD